MTRRSWLLLGLLLLLQGLLVWGVFLPSPHSGGDNAGYVALGHALVSGEGYTEVWDPAAPPHTKYPPVFPALLAVAMALGATGWASLKVVPVLATLLAVAGVFLWARRRLGEEAGFAVALLTGVTPSLLYHSHWLLSDVPFLAFTVLALWRLEGLVAGPGTGSSGGGPPVSSSGEGSAGEGSAKGGAPPVAAEPPPTPWLHLLLATLLVALAYFTRSAGLPLVVAGVAALAWRRRWRETAVVGFGVGVPALLWLLRNRAAGPGQGRYGSEFLLLDPYQPDLGGAGVGDFVARVVANLSGYGTRFLPETFSGAASPPLVLLSLALVALALVGWARAVRSGPGTAEIFMPLYAGLILLWPPVWSGDRFALPLVPLVLVFAAEGIRALGGRFAPGTRVALLGAAALLVAAPAANDWFRTRTEQAACRGALEAAGPWACGGNALVDFVAAARWAGENLPEGAGALTRKPRIWYLMSGVPTRTYPFTEVPGALLADAREAGAEYVVLDFIGSQGARYVGGAVGSEPGAFCQAAVFGGGAGLPPTRLLGIVPPGAEWGSRVEDGQIRLATCPGPVEPQAMVSTATPGAHGWRIPLLER